MPPKKGSSKSNEGSVRTHGVGLSSAFFARQEALAAKQGRGNATAASRRAVAMPEDDIEFDGDGVDLGDTASVATGVSVARSLHPSVAPSVAGRSCSDVTIGAGDDTGYWDYQHRFVTKQDIGQKCRECKQAFRSLGEPLTERRGARISMRYHAGCFSGFADPRSQAESSAHTGRLAGTQLAAAPQRKATTKMRTGSHFEGGGQSRYQQSACTNKTSVGGHGGAGLAWDGAQGSDDGRDIVGKLGANRMHGGGFGARSSKPNANAVGAIEGAELSKTMTQPQRAPGGLTEQSLAAHLQRMELDSDDCGAGAGPAVDCP